MISGENIEAYRRDVQSVRVAIYPLLRELTYMPSCILSRHVTEREAITIRDLCSMFGLEIPINGEFVPAYEINIKDIDWDLFHKMKAMVYQAIGQMEFEEMPTSLDLEEMQLRQHIRGGD